MRTYRSIGTVLAVALVLGACQDQMTEPTPTPGAASVELAQQSSLAADFDADRIQLQMELAGPIADHDFAELACRAINGDDYVCPPSTDVIDYYLNSFYSALAAERANTILLYNLSADLIPTYEALYFQTTDDPQYFGYSGEYTEVMMETERDIKRFWDIFSADIQVIGMHGSMLLDVDRVSRTYQLFGYSAADAMSFATAIRNTLLVSVAFNGGNHPFFSFNAFAASFGGPYPDKIVMGDGIMAAYAALGFGDVAPQAIFAHEFAHHIQFENGYFNDPIASSLPRPERTRYTELMSDAMSAYYMTHKRGLAMNKHRVEQFLEVFFQIGDCAFTNNGHHGTPNQRMRAAQFGFDVADSALKQGHILTSEQFYDLFVAVFPDLIAPDAI